MSRCHTPRLRRRILACLAFVAGAGTAMGFGAPASDDAAGRAAASEKRQPGAKPIAVRPGGGARPRRGRVTRRRSLVFFAQLTDPQISDETTPARFDFLGPRRTQEAFGTHVVDQTVRAGNRSAPARCRVPGAGRGSASRS